MNPSRVLALLVPLALAACAVDPTTSESTEVVPAESAEENTGAPLSTLKKKVGHTKFCLPGEVVKCTLGPPPVCHCEPGQPPVLLAK